MNSRRNRAVSCPNPKRRLRGQGYTAEGAVDKPAVAHAKIGPGALRNERDGARSGLVAVNSLLGISDRE